MDEERRRLDAIDAEFEPQLKEVSEELRLEAQTARQLALNREKGVASEEVAVARNA